MFRLSKVVYEDTALDGKQTVLQITYRQFELDRLVFGGALVLLLFLQILSHHEHRRIAEAATLLHKVFGKPLLKFLDQVSDFIDSTVRGFLVTPCGSTDLAGCPWLI